MLRHPTLPLTFLHIAFVCMCVLFLPLHFTPTPCAHCVCSVPSCLPSSPYLWCGSGILDNVTYHAWGRRDHLKQQLYLLLSGEGETSSCGPGMEVVVTVTRIASFLAPFSLFSFPHLPHPTPCPYSLLPVPSLKSGLETSRLHAAQWCLFSYHLSPIW